MLNRDSLMSLEEYAKRRNAFRTEVMEHKKSRKMHLGEHVTVLFEDALTVQYQVQEMLRGASTNRKEKRFTALASAFKDLVINDASAILVR